MLGKTMGHYEIGDRLGEGGSGVVYRGRDLRLERPVALKILADQLRDDELAWARLLREARLASNLNHPHIAAIYDLGEEADHAYIVMELIEGLPLSELIPEGGMGLEQVRRYGAQIADALGYAHQHGVIHGDLKGSNVLVTSDGAIKLLDFGLGRRIPRSGMEEVTRSRLSLAEAGATAGTLPYLAPEVLRGGITSPQSDTWALGVLLYQMATGELPFQGATPFELSMEIMVGAPPKLGQIGEPLQSILRRCLVKDPAERCREAREVVTALESDRESPAPPPPPSVAASSTASPGPVANTAPGNRRRWWIAAGGAVALLALVLALILARHGLASHTARATTRESKTPSGFGVGNPVIKVWVNTRTGAYHCPGTTWYGKTQEGEYMTQQDAQAKGYHPAAQRACL
jgi:serine/threonine-protein kinase